MVVQRTSIQPLTPSKTISSNKGKSCVSSPTSVVTAPLHLQDKEEPNEEFQKYRILLEYKHLTEYPPSGVYVVPSYNNSHLFYGVIFVRDGMYQNAIFKFKITLPPYYNNVNSYPSVTFFAEVVHPYVDIKTGKLDLTAIFPSWDPKKHALGSVVLFIKKMFYITAFAEVNKGNRNAWLLSSVDPIGYKNMVYECVDESQRHVKDEPGSSIKFSPTDDEKYQILRSLMKDAMEEKNDNVKKEHILKMVADTEAISKINSYGCISFFPKEWW